MKPQTPKPLPRPHLSGRVIVLVVCVLATGCGKKPHTAAAPNDPATPPAAQACMTAWLSGDKPAAIKAFIQADWTGRTLFPRDSTLSLSEAEFVALPAAEREARSGEMLSQLDVLKKLSAAVTQAGRDAAAAGDVAHAHTYFGAVQSFGKALDDPNRLRIVQLVGQACGKTAEAELAKARK